MDGIFSYGGMRRKAVALLVAAWTVFSGVCRAAGNPAGADAAAADSLDGWHFVERPIAPDSCDVARLERKSFWRAGAETAGLNIGLWAFDRYALKGHYAYISWSTIKENFRHGFEWDNDHLNTNMFAHPYNGSLFFNAGRSNGFNFWQSELFAIGGSAMWEMFMECEYPSTNDIIATPVGGAAIGEVLYRASDLMLDDRSAGGERFGRELAAFVINPMRGFTRVVTGRAWERRATSGKRFGLPQISVNFALGGRWLDIRRDDYDVMAGSVAELYVEYGDKFAEKSSAPYDYFSFLVELQRIKTQPVLGRLNITGRLLSREMADGKRLKMNVGLYQHFDYFDSDTIRPREEKNMPLSFSCAVPYKLGTPASLGGGFMFRYMPVPAMRFDGYLHVNGVILAGILTDFYRVYHRNYNWGSGFSIKSGVSWSILDNKFAVNVANQLYRIYTWQGYDPDYNWSLTPEGKPVNVQGDASRFTFNHLEVVVDYRLWKRLYLTAGLDWYMRRTLYDDMMVTEKDMTYLMPAVKSRQIGYHLMFTYKF